MKEFKGVVEFEKLNFSNIKTKKKNKKRRQLKLFGVVDVYLKDFLNLLPKIGMI